MNVWNYAVLLKGIAQKDPARTALVDGTTSRTWGEFHDRANALAADMLAAGMSHQAKVAHYMYNCPEYLETTFASWLGGFVPFNVNYRYGAEEVHYLFDNADAEAIVFHGAFAGLIDSVRARLPLVKRFYMVPDAENAVVPPWALDYNDVVARTVADVTPQKPWSGDDMLFLYTGGTTGMPKGVMWRQEDLFEVLGHGANALFGMAAGESVADLIDRVTPDWPSTRSYIACPLMHGTGLFSAFITLAAGGAIVTNPNRHFSATELLDIVERERANVIVIVGQAFAGPILEALDANPGRWDLSSVVQMGSSGVMWSQENKNGLLEHIPQMAITDSFGSSEAVGMGASVAVKGQAPTTAKFQLGPKCVVFTEDGRRVEPGSGERGLVAVGGAIPMGYYKDPVKSEATFRIFEGKRWTVPGDWAEVNEDGTLTLLGRGSVCINTGGEKVFPEEVEECLKTHASVRDAVAVGIPDARFGETICAVVEAEPGSTPELEELSAWVRSRLAAYKAPRNLVVVDTIGRAPNGKVDYKRLKQHSMDTLGVK
jgi:fatty-acyl-CoA synthase